MTHAASDPAAAPTGDPYRGRKPLPLAWLGYAYATAVGLAWGSILSTGRIERRDGLWIFRGMPNWAFGRGGSCVGACYLTDTNISEAVIRHERVHRSQWRHYGLLMPLLYFRAGRDPLRNRFEIEAGLEDGGYLRRVPDAESEGV
ncbi:Fe-S oxidoreductase [Leucobacter sp. CSA2]|uniref:Fe-S oxidoreductase n=1 Tax=Leucobacter edaphi TaxID=2796472 RepID=A0A934QDA9_9MICO|nr:Fe-S oxidoreductase [Leucobacter edaphi]MBK0420967.1 Fe-S oxidoreductase [Leucobacter edaphi]